jgi:hypothetical protein
VLLLADPFSFRVEPALAAIGERWPAIAAQDTFEQGVRAFLDGLLARTAD